jgi:hypothetical protein
MPIDYYMKLEMTLNKIPSARNSSRNRNNIGLLKTGERSVKR